MDASSLNGHVIVAVLSGVFSVVAAVPYVLSILRGETKPNAISWGLWSLLQGIALVAQFKAGASWSAVLIFFVTLNTVVVTVFALTKKYGYREYGAIDGISAVLAILAIVAWQLTGNPIAAIVSTIVADACAAFPTMVKAKRDPRSENPTGWGFLLLASILGVASTERFDAQNLAFPLCLVVMSCIIFCFAYFGRRSS